MPSRIHIRIFGDVQGVFFRAGVQEEAQRLGLKGWVRNRDDGSVEVVAEGGTEALRELLEWCSHGPIGASVSRCEHEWLSGTGGFAGFEIKRG
jgi:acylphosphatase